MRWGEGVVCVCGGSGDGVDFATGALGQLYPPPLPPFFQVQPLM